MLHLILTIVQVFSSVAIIALVLLQRGKGAEAGAGLGAGASGTVFGARGARTALSRATAVFAAVFMINSLALAYMGRQSAAEPKSILDEAAQSAPQPAKPLPVTPPPPSAPGKGTH
jgi:preprotein translocase subunit SecG